MSINCVYNKTHRLIDKLTNTRCKDMDKLNFSGKIIALIGDAKYFEKSGKSVTLGNDINIYLKRKTKGANLVKVIDDENGGYIVKAFDNQPKKRSITLVLEANASNDNELMECLKQYF